MESRLRLYALSYALLTVPMVVAFTASANAQKKRPEFL